VSGVTTSKLDIAATRTEVLRQLGTVDDPCSVAMSAPLSIVELGLVRGIDIGEDGAVTVTISPTSPGCMLIPRIAEAAHDAALSVPGVRSVDIAVDHGFAWSQAAMTEEARASMEERRNRMVRELDIRPRQWQLRPTETPPQG
jgi:metal-sulfur cluster biosynthetic enzyme